MENYGHTHPDVKESPSKAKFWCYTDQRKWAVTQRSTFPCILIFSLGTQFLGISVENQKHDEIKKTNACQCRIRSDRTLSGHLVQDSFRQFLRKSPLQSACLPGYTVSPKRMTAAAHPWHCLSVTSQTLLCDSCTYIPVVDPRACQETRLIGVPRNCKFERRACSLLWTSVSMPACTWCFS